MPDEISDAKIQEAIRGACSKRDFIRQTSSWPLEAFDRAERYSAYMGPHRLIPNFSLWIEEARRERTDALNREAADRVADEIKKAYTTGAAQIEKAVKEAATPNLYVRYGFWVMVLTLIAAAIAAWPVLRPFFG